MKDTGTEIRNRRKALKLTQADLAKKIGVNTVAVHNWESNKNGVNGQNVSDIKIKSH